MQHARPLCPSPTPGVHSNSCPLSRRCHLTISSSAVPFSSWLQSFPVSESFPVSWFFASGGQRIRVSVSASVLPMNIQDWFPLGRAGQGGLAFCGSWGRKESDTNEQLNWTELIVKATIFPVIMYGCESWTIKKAKHQRIDAFTLRCCTKLLTVPWTARRSNQSILKEINPEYSLEELMLKLKL